MLCEYSDIFGKPNEGVHSIRIFNIAIVDLFLTILVAYFASIYFNESFLFVLLILLIIGIVLHRLFCVRTTIDKILF